MTVTLHSKLQRLTLVTIASAATVLAGCTTMLDHVQVNDEHTRDVAGSIVIHPDSFQSRSGRGGKGGIEFAYEMHFGTGEQTLAGSHFLTLGGQTITGPQTVSNQAVSEHGHIAYDRLIPFGEYFELEPSVGIAYDTTYVTSQSNALPASKISVREGDWGANVVLTPRWNFNPYVAFEGRFRVSVLGNGSVSTTTLPSLVLRPISNVAINAGYVWYRQTLDTPDGTSNVNIKFQGPSVAMRLSF